MIAIDGGRPIGDKKKRQDLQYGFGEGPRLF
jgi:hypothetical protein